MVLFMKSHSPFFMNLLEHTPPKPPYLTARSVRPQQSSGLEPVAATQVEIGLANRLVDLQAPRFDWSLMRHIEPRQKVTNVGPLMVEVAGAIWTLILLALSGIACLLDYDNVSRSLSNLAKVAAGITVALVIVTFMVSLTRVG